MIAALNLPDLHGLVYNFARRELPRVPNMSEGLEARQ